MTILRLAFLLLLLLLLLILAAAGASPALAARSVALVYDDSGSMRDEERWLYANYALETLLALLGREDRLHLVAMSAPGRAELLADAAARRRAIERLKRARPPAKGTPTPYRAVRTAMDALRREASGERWLVVITDGVFDAAADGAGREGEFLAFVAETGAHPVVLLIGEGADRSLAEAWRRQGQAALFQATDSAGIVDRVRDVATLLNARQQQPAALDAAQDGNAIRLSPRFPLRRLTVLSQGDGRGRVPARLTGVAVESAAVEREQFEIAMVQAPKQGGRSEGVVSHVLPRPAGTVIPEGRDRLRLFFDAPVDRAELRVYPEVAARLEVELRDGRGRRLDGGAGSDIRVCAGQPVRVVARLTTDDGRALAEGRPDRGDFAAAFQLDDGPPRPMALDAPGREFTGQLQASPGSASLSVAASFPGYFDFRSRVFRIAAETCEPPALSLEVDSGAWRADSAALEEGSVRLSPRLDGAALDAAEFAGWQARVVGDPALPFTLEANPAAAEWRLRPHYRWGCRCLTPTGAVPVRVAVTAADGRHLEVAVPLAVAESSWWERCRTWFQGLLASALALWYLAGVLRKPRFRPGTVVFHERNGRRSTVALPGSFASRWLIPYRAERRSIGEAAFKATRSSARILLAKETQHERMTVAGQPIDEPGRRDLPLANGESLRVAGRHAETYTYSSI
jgi:hypothetical protein